MRALVTGAAGFIGSALTDRLLCDGHEVIGVDCLTDYYSKAQKLQNLASARASTRFRFDESDLLDAELDTLLEGCSVVFHLAGCPGVRASWGDQFEAYVRGNVVVTQRLLEAARRQPIERFVYSSSSSVYGTPPRFPSSETDVPAPHSPYGVTKLAGEHLAVLYNRNHRVPTVSLRYFTVYGPRQRPDMAIQRLIRAALAGDRFELFGDGTQIRDFTYVQDVVEANIRAATSENLADQEDGAVMNIGGGTAISMNELIAAVEAATGRTLEYQQTSMVSGDVRRTQADTSRAERLLGWTPRYSLAQGLAKHVAHVEATL